MKLVNIHNIHNTYGDLI